MSPALLLLDTVSLVNVHAVKSSKSNGKAVFPRQRSSRQQVTEGKFWWAPRVR